MKMTQKCFDDMRNDICAVADKSGLDFSKAEDSTMWALLTIVSRNRAYNDEHPGFKSGQWTRLLTCDNRDYCWYYNDGEGLNDTHVATALRKIRSEAHPKIYS